MNSIAEEKKKVTATNPHSVRICLAVATELYMSWNRAYLLPACRYIHIKTSSICELKQELPNKYEPTRRHIGNIFYYKFEKLLGGNTLINEPSFLEGVIIWSHVHFLHLTLILPLLFIYPKTSSPQLGQNHLKYCLFHSFITTPLLHFLYDKLKNSLSVFILLLVCSI